MSFLGLPVLSKADVVSLILQGCILELHDQNVICAIREHGGIHFPKSIQVLANRCGQSLWAKFVPCEVLKGRSVCTAPQRHTLLLSWLGVRLQSDFRTLWNVKAMVRRSWFSWGSTLLSSYCLQTAIKCQEKWSSGNHRQCNTRRQLNWAILVPPNIILPKYITWKYKFL